MVIAVETLAVTDCVMERDTYVDDIGRIFCLAHKRAICHICCFNFEMMNEMAEANAGLRKHVNYSTLI